MTLAETLAQAAARLPADSPRADAEILLAYVLGCTRAALFARLRDSLPPADALAYEVLLARRVRGEPVAYIIGEKGFWTLTLKVTPAVLVPRPETELLVEWALTLLASPSGRGRRAAPGEGRDLQIADLGTGSGCIALALATELPGANILATDLSEDALAVARENARLLGLARVQFLRQGFSVPLPPQDLIVSNPPYIAARDAHLDALRHEPLIALTDGDDGLQCLREIIASAAASLKPGGWLLVEHGFDQGAPVRELFAQAGFASIETRRDLGGQERATGGQLAAIVVA